MKIETYINSLVAYAINNGLAEPEDWQVLINRLLDLLRKDDYEPSDEPMTEDLEEILGGFWHMQWKRVCVTTALPQWISLTPALWAR